MALRLCSGFEIGPTTATVTGNPDGYGSGVSRNTTEQRTGAACLAVASATAATVATSYTPSLTGTWTRIYAKLNALPSTTVAVVSAGPVRLRVTAAGALQVGWYNGTSWTDSSVSGSWTTSVWNRVEIALVSNGTAYTSYEVRLNGTTLVNASQSMSAVLSALTLGDTPAGGQTMYFDDLQVNDSSGTTHNSWCNDGYVLLSVPTGDYDVQSWVRGGTGGTGTGALYEAVNNTPPIGVAAANANATNNTQIRSTTNGSLYVGVCPTLATLGMNAADSVAGVTAVGWHGEEVNTGTKVLTIGVERSGGFNEIIATTGSVNAGGDAGAEGAWPTLWACSTATGNAYTLDSTYSVRPRVSMTSGASRAASVCFLGAYIACVTAPPTQISVSDVITVVDGRNDAPTTIEKPGGTEKIVRCLRTSSWNLTSTDASAAAIWALAAATTAASSTGTWEAYWSSGGVTARQGILEWDTSIIPAGSIVQQASIMPGATSSYSGTVGCPIRHVASGTVTTASWWQGNPLENIGPNAGTYSSATARLDIANPSSIVVNGVTRMQMAPGDWASTGYVGDTSATLVAGELDIRYLISTGTPVNVTDATSTTDAASISTAIPVTESVADTDTATVARATSVTDTVASADTAAATVPVAVSDSATAADSAVAPAVTHATTDTVTDADAATLAATTAVTDTTSLADTQTSGRSQTDTITGTDSAVVDRASTVTDTITATDTGVPTLGVTDTTSSADTAGLTVAQAVTDITSNADAVTSGRPVTDTVSLADSVVVAPAIAVTDTVTGTDTASVNTGSNIAVTDTITATDAATQSASPATTDTVALADSAAQSTSPGVTDTTSLADSAVPTIGVVDTTTTTDSAAAPAVSLAVTDTTTGADSASVATGANPAVTDTVAVADAASISATQAVVDTATAADTATVAATLPGVTDATTGADSALVTADQGVTDTTATAETQALVVDVPVVELIATVDTASMAGNLDITVTDAIALGEMVTLDTGHRAGRPLQTWVFRYGKRWKPADLRRYEEDLLVEAGII